MKPTLFLALIFIVTACSTPEPRSPIQQTKPKTEPTSVQINKELLLKETELIERYIANQSELVFNTSPSGLWFAASDVETIPPQKGTRIDFEYEVFDLNNTRVYDRKTIGKQSYYVNEQPIMFGLKEALFILKEGASGTFLLPSILAYGVLGDQNKIGSNTPLVIQLKITNIETANK
ncbi:MAG: hypothetical protein P8L72_02490 [Flavobacteriaceae bacterium]|nr:hypothetical protein [Flavobacteriaceae bacterium]MDG2314240.1 hypothetical protein [Flavobacteriaceae bacterium]